MKIIGYTNDSYPERRTIIDNNLHPLKKVKSVNMYFPQAAMKRIPYIGKKINTYFYEKILFTKEVDGIHFFNSVTNKDIPWISTFETLIPRTTATAFIQNGLEPDDNQTNMKHIKKYLKLLAKEQCKKIIALSEMNKKMQLHLLNYFPEYQAVIEKKLIQMNPPQKKIRERKEVEEKEINHVLKFLFVGKFFNLKGGKEIVDVFDKIKKETNFEFELHIVSLGDMKNHAFGEYKDTEEEIEEVNKKIKNNDSITLHHYIENNQLLEMMKTFDVGLLPTWADTYGYSVLEFQASGCPVVSTDVRALPEINNDSVGWMIKLPINEFGEVHIKSHEEKLAARTSMQNQLESIILNILKHPEQLKEKSLNAYDQVTKNHSIEAYMKMLSEIYEENF